jgi:autotransporter-associated beta strand protein
VGRDGRLVEVRKIVAFKAFLKNFLGRGDDLAKVRTTKVVIHHDNFQTPQTHNIMKLRRFYSRSAVQTALAIGLLALVNPLHAQTNGTWTTNGPGNWSDTANWSAGAVAGGESAIANFSTLDIAANHTVTLDAPVTIGTLTLQDATTTSNNWIFAGTEALTLNNGASQPVFNILNRVHVISAPLVGTNGFSKTGAGAVDLTGDNSGLSGTLDLPNVTGTNGAGVRLSGTSALGGLTTINIGGTTTTGQYLSLFGTTTVGSGVTINLNSQGGNSAPVGGLRADGLNTDVVTINGPVNVTLTGNAARIANNSAKRLDINGKITGAAGLVFRFGKNEGIHITNAANTWSGTTVHSEEILWFEPGSLPTTTNLQLCASGAGHVQTSGSFTRALGTLANQVQFTNSAARAQGFGARGGELTLNFGGAGADVLFDTAAAASANRIRTNTLVLNGGFADSNIILVNPLDINGAVRTIQNSTQTATLQGGIKGGAFAVSKTGLGTLNLVTANTWTGDLNLPNNAGVVRLSHNEALGPVATVKNVNTTGSNQIVGLIELPGGISIDENKTLRMGGKAFYGNALTAIGDQSALRSIGNNTWAGSAVIGSTGGAYGIESVSGTLTLGADPATTKIINNSAGDDTRVLSIFGAGDVVMNLKIADNGLRNTSFIKVGSGKLSITRGDNDFDQVPSMRSGVTEVVKLADSTVPSSLGVAASFNVGGTLRYLGTGDSSNRALGLFQTGGTLDSSGTGALVLSSNTMSHQAGVTTTVCAPFAEGATTLLLNDPSGIAVGQTITGTNIPAGTTITSVNVDTRAIEISQATSAASTTGLTMTIGAAATLDRTLSLTGTNADDNIFAANLTDPGVGKLGITKTGSGTWILSGATKASTGPVAVQEGTLGIEGTMPAGLLTVAPTATLALNNVNLTNADLDIDGTLELAGPVEINPLSIMSPGSYSVLQYGALTGSGTLTSSFRGATFDTSTSPTSTTLVVGAGSALTWSGANGPTWDVMTTNNWLNSSSAPDAFYFLDSVTFDETGSVEPIVSLNEEVRPASITVNNPTTDYSIEGTGTISGLGGLTKSGAGKLTLATANTFSGDIQLNAGTLAAGNNRAFGANEQMITVTSGATLDTAGYLNVSRDYDVTIAGSGVGGSGAIINSGIENQAGFRSITLSADASIGGTARWDMRPITAGSGLLDLANFKLTKVGLNNIALVDGVISNDGSIDINEGMLTMTRMNVTGAGSINVNLDAILRFENNTTGYYAKDIALDNGRIELTGSNLTLDAPIDVTNVGNLHVAFTRALFTAQPITGTGSLSMTSSGAGAVGVLVLLNENTYAGATTVDTGTLRIGNRTATGSINTQPVTLSNNGNLQISRSDNTMVFPNVIEGAGNVIIGVTAAVTAPEYDSLVTLTGTNTFTGGLTVSSGGVKIQNAAALGSGAKTVNLTNGTAGRPQFYLDGSSANITVPDTVSFVTSSTNLSHPAIGNLAGDNVISGSITLAAGGGSTAVSVLGGSLALNGGIASNSSGRALILGGVSGTTGTINGVVSDGTNPVGIQVSGENVWKLTSANTYTGNTTVNSGTLLVNGIQNIGTGAVNVVGGTIGGIGTIGGNVTVQAAGSIAPGEGIGILTTSNAATIDGTLSVDIDGTSADKLVVGSTLDVGGATLTVNEAGAGLTLPVYIIAQASAPIVGTFATTNIPAGYNAVVNYDGLNQIALVKGTPYSNWETANGITAAGAAADSDNDGVSNGIEFVIGGDPSGPGSDSNSLLPTVATTETHLIFVFRRSDVSASYEPFVEYSNSLDGWATAEDGTDGVVITEENDPFPSEPGIDRVTVSIPRTLAAPGTKLFARLKMVVP